jgi:hypothetical protein
LIDIEIEASHFDSRSSSAKTIEGEVVDMQSMHMGILYFDQRWGAEARKGATSGDRSSKD